MTAIYLCKMAGYDAEVVLVKAVLVSAQGSLAEETGSLSRGTHRRQRHGLCSILICVPMSSRDGRAYAVPVSCEAAQRSSRSARAASLVA